MGFALTLGVKDWKNNPPVLNQTAATDDKDKWVAFRAQLERNHVWPSLYTFKFIVPAHKAGEVKELFPLHLSTERNSGNGNYISLTFRMMMPGSDSIISVYKKVQHIEGIIAL